MAWVEAHWHTRCHECEEDIVPGDRVWYEVHDGIFCEECGREVSGETDSEDKDSN